MNILKKGRMAGIVDWAAIEDRVRRPILPYWVTGIQDAINDTISQYRLNRMKGQDSNIEVWVEKDALPPKELIRLCEEAIAERIDLDQYQTMLAQEKKDIITMKSKFNLNNNQNEDDKEDQ